MLHIQNQDTHELMIQRRFLQFLLEFKIADERSQSYTLFYIEEATKIVASDSSTLYFNYDHLSSLEGFKDVADSMINEFYRFEPYLRKAVQEFIFRVTNEIQEGKVYYLSVYNLPNIEKIRDLRASKIGKLTAFQGTVTRTSEVRPELVSGTFTCLMCSEAMTFRIQKLFLIC